MTINRFRTARGRRLRAKIEAMAQRLGRPVSVLDVGGRPDYWSNVGVAGISGVTLLNYDEAEIRRGSDLNVFTHVVGDARDMRQYADGSFDLVHSNSVIEHVGMWDDMRRMANETMRVGVEGWIQTPAWEFPIEPHYRLPFVHWFGQPMRRRMLWFSPTYGRLGVAERRGHIDRINLVSRDEVAALYPGRAIWTERVALWPKSYVVTW